MPLLAQLYAMQWVMDLSAADLYELLNLDLFKSVMHRFVAVGE